ncbi:MAG: cytochrome c biogenesis protein CcdA [Patescibacteria group bacterium]
MTAGYVVSAFIAGVLMFLAPCTLPLVPGYLAFISGSKTQKAVFLNGLFFTLGFSIVFIFFGAVFGALGYSLAPYRMLLSEIGGVFIIIFGLFMVGVLKVPYLETEKRIRAPRVLKVGNIFSSLLLGAIFAAGWTPCVGPILGSILLLAASTVTVASGAILLGIFSLGLMLPFLTIAFLYGRAIGIIARTEKVLKYINVIGGLFLIFIGSLLFFDKMGILVTYGFWLFDFMQYGRLLDYM